MIELDGRTGEGGGQILRTGLSLATLTGQAVHFTHIRAKRRKPGLMRQHLTCARAAAEICGGRLEYAELNSQELIFEPGKPTAGEYNFAIGSAGSTLLAAQTVLPCLMTLSAGSRVVIEGGTHVDGAPVFEFFERVYLPCLRLMGANVSVRLERMGFYPVGGGKIVLETGPAPAKWKPFERLERGGITGPLRLEAIGCGIGKTILADELRFCREALAPHRRLEAGYRFADSPGPGNVFLAGLDFEHGSELFSVCGARNLSRKAVGERAAHMVESFLASGTGVWRFLADQLLLPMAIAAGGGFRTCAPSQHTETNIGVIRAFSKAEITVEEVTTGIHQIEVKV